MKAALFRRLLWKEYRVLRGFWLALAAFACLGFLGVWCFAENPDDRITGTWAVATLIPALYALGAAATLFAVEREEETREFLRALPLASSQLFVGKLTMALVSTSALAIVLALLAAKLCRWEVPDKIFDLNLSVFGVGAIEALAWGTFFSMTTSRPALAAFLAAAAVAVGVPVLIGLFGATVAPNVLEPETFAAVTRWRLLAALGMLICDGWLGRNWLHGRPRRANVDASRVARGVASKLWMSVGAVPSLVRERRGPGGAGSWSVFGRLVWHEFRQVRRLGLVLAGIAAALSFVPRSDSGTILAVAIPLALMGGCVFLADQERERFRFFAERGISPWTVWLSRQTVWLAILLVTVLLLTLVHLCLVWQLWPMLAPSNRFGTESSWVRSLVANLTNIGIQMDVGASHNTKHLRLNFQPGNFVVACLVLAMGYSAGQLASMFIRRGISACFFGLWLAGLMCCWGVLMLYIRANWLWSIAPIPLTLLFATWLRAPDWILERKDWRARTRAAASLVVPAAVLFAAVAVFRVEQVPFVAPPSDLPPPTPEARETTEMYRRAYLELTDASLAGWAPGAGSFEPAEPAMSLAVEASRRESCALGERNEPGETSDLDRAGRLADILLQHAGALARDGKLDLSLARYLAVLRIAGQMYRQPTPTGPARAAALERIVLDALPPWAAMEGQTPEQIRGAAGKLADLERPFVSLLPALDGEYELQRELMAAGPTADEKQWEPPSKLIWWMPWERIRARRLLAKIAQEERAALSAVEMVLKGNTAVARVLPFAYDKNTLEWLRTTVLPSGGGGSGPGLASLECEMETRRRAVRLVLALLAFRAEKGDFAATLDELGDVGRIRDPYTGEAFHYFRDGLSGYLAWFGVPLVWSPGPGIALRITNRRRQAEYIADLTAGRQRPERGTNGINNDGLVFPLRPPVGGP